MNLFSLLLHSLFVFLVSAGDVVIAVNTANAGPRPPLLGMGWEMWQMFNYLPFLGDSRYNAIAAKLGGSIVRIGGITADWTTYSLVSSDLSSSEVPLSFWPLYETNLTVSSFESLLTFFGAANITVMFDLNELLGRNCNITNPNVPYGPGEWCEGEWDMSNVEAFLHYIHDHIPSGPGATLASFELGNELVSHLDPAANVADIVALASMIQSIWSDVPAAQRPLLYAPSTDSCSTPGQLDIMRNITGVAGVGGYTYHSYPGGGCTNPGGLAGLLLNSTWLRTQILVPGAPCLAAWNAGPRAAGLALLVTESSSSWSTSCAAPAQNSFVNGFFSIAEWGQFAGEGISLLARWAFSEASPFALITQNGTRWDVAHDFFLLVTQGKYAGDASLTATGSEASDALVYAYCASASTSPRNGSLLITAVNPSSTAITLSFVSAGTGSPIIASPRLELVFTAPGGNLSSTTPILNGAEATPLRINEDGSLPPMPPLYIDDGSASVTLPPLSQSFFVLLSAQASACM